MNWQWSLNWDEVRTDMVIGSCPMIIEDIDRICEEAGATALLSLQSEECRSAFGIDYESHREHGVARGALMLNTPMLDFNPPDQRINLPQAVRALAILLATSHRVYVHCTAGLNRAPLAVLAYLAFVELVPPEEALTFIRRVRPAAEPSWEAFHGCREDIVVALRDHVSVRAYYLAQQYPANDPLNNWSQAETDIIRAAFLSKKPVPGPRQDPNRPR